jgi:hypothetical protein
MKESPMNNIIIGRCDKDPEAQGVICPEDGRWQLVIDKDGYPHLYVQCNIKDDESGELTKGLFLIDELLPEHMSIRDLMDGSEFGGTLSPEEEEEAYVEWLERKERLKLPCPRPRT